MEDAIKYLRISTDSYEKLVFKHWFHWCEQYAAKKLDVPTQQLETDTDNFQQLLANTALFNYWLKMYREYEVEFCMCASQLKEYPGAEDMKKLYEKYVWNVKQYYSKKLIENATKLTLNPQLN